MVGVMVIAGVPSSENPIFLGVLAGLLSACAISIRNIIIKKDLVSFNSFYIMKYQVSIIALCYLPYVLFNVQEFSFNNDDFYYLLLLVLIPTMTGHTILVQSLKNFRASTSSIVSSTQIIYGTLFGFLVLSEIPSLNIFFGAVIIVSVVLHKSFLKEDI
jgi:drug/metabolite transporter (DMT)-like permease